ncbi:Two pore calcium channel protein 2 [Paragonimus heterotremus]|uniref:Two pore calcium channel protein 2 n=1 Tax=Paragonimus heterotremus TaxID=100268 RepID=A0A8J4TI58_9TREM|nr:Two pore calcium channel protein 2 [Paragonimus heterotremus]
MSGFVEFSHTLPSTSLGLHDGELHEIQARILIEDAENHRSIFHKLDKRSLYLYNILHSFWFRRLFGGAICLLLLLPFFEWPSSLTLNSNLRNNLQRPRLPCGVTESVEFVCFLVVVTESVLLSFVFGGSWVKTNPWLLGRFVLYTVYFLDFLVSLGFRCNEFYRVRRFLRPYFFISSSQLMKKLLNCVRRTLPKLLSTLFLLLFWLVSASLVALCLFSTPQRLSPGRNVTEPASFPDFYTSMFNLLVLITTANHPDVILQEYIENRAVAIFSMVFLGVGLYVFMNILTAIVYSEFRGYLASSVQSRLTRRRVATRAAFEVLRFADKESDVVTNDQVIKLIDNVRISRWKKEALRMAYLSSFAESDLNASEFMQLFRTLDLSAPPFQESLLRPVQPGFTRMFQAWVTSSSFARLSIAISLLNIVHLVIDMSERITTASSVSVQMRVINWCFVAFYLFEELSLLWAVGRKTFFSHLSNLFSLGTVVLLIIVKLVELGFLIAELNGRTIAFVDFSLWDLVRLTNILLLTRAIRVVHLFTWTELVAGVLKSLPRNLAPVLGILVSAYYTYALLGMNLFRGVIVFNPNVTQSEGFECGTYQQLDYWPINFDDFAASIFLLWCLMVVNNWYVIVVAYQRALSRWVHVYMISWWIVTVVGLLSLVTAFVIETFVHRRDLYTKALEFANRPREVHIRNGVCSLSPVTESRPPTCITPHSSFHCVNKSGAVNSQNFNTTRLPAGFIERQISMFRIEPLAGSSQRLLSGLHASSLDGLFRSELREPCEAELLSQVYEHHRFRQLREQTQSHRYTEPIQ